MQRCTLTVGLCLWSQGCLELLPDGWQSSWCRAWRHGDLSDSGARSLIKRRSCRWSRTKTTSLMWSVTPLASFLHSSLSSAPPVPELPECLIPRPFTVSSESQPDLFICLCASMPPFSSTHISLRTTESTACLMPCSLAPGTLSSFFYFCQLLWANSAWNNCSSLCPIDQTVFVLVLGSVPSFSFDSTQHLLRWIRPPVLCNCAEHKEMLLFRFQQGQVMLHHKSSASCGAAVVSDKSIKANSIVGVGAELEQ